MKMQRILFLLICLIYFSPAFSQSLEGLWEGWYTDTNERDTTVFKLQFELNKDSAYNVYSFTRHKNFKSVCKMKYTMLSTRSIQLEEVELVRSVPDFIRDIAFQKMILDLTNGFRTMRGKWQNTDEKTKNSGNVFLLKK